MRKSIPGAMPVIEWSAKHVAAVPAAGGSASVSDTVSGAADKAGLAKAVVLALSRRSAFVRTTHVPNINEREITQVLALQVGKLFPITQGKVAYDFKLGTELTQEGRVASVMATSDETLKLAKEDLAKAGYHVAACVPSALGALALAGSLNITDCAVVEIGFEGLSVDIVKDGLLRYSRVAPKTEDPEAIQDEVCRTYSSVGIACGPVLAAGGLNLPTADYHSRTSTLEALAGVGLGLGVNVEQPEEVARREAKQASNRARFAALLCVAAVMLGALAFMDRSDQSAAVDTRNAEWMANSRSARQERDAAKQKAANAKVISDSVRRLFEPAQRSSDILVLIGNSVPEGAWITGVNYDRGRVVQIRGTAVNNQAVTAYLEALTAQERFRDVKLVFANNATIEQTEVVNFSISAWAVGNLPLEDVKKGAKR
ncbi:MAG: PilN domain-containing protein [Fimbriimonadaceae bacterium]|nr:PilN domain-containing protein [Fimbriimonadaceae bacterium]